MAWCTTGNAIKPRGRGSRWKGDREGQREEKMGGGGIAGVVDAEYIYPFVNSGLMLARRGLEGRKGVFCRQTMGSLGCSVPSFHSRTSLDRRCTATAAFNSCSLFDWTCTRKERKEKRERKRGSKVREQDSRNEIEQIGL